MKVLQKNLSEILIFIFFLSLYAATSARTIIQGDSGDFLATAATGGIPHPSGYPLYSLLARLFYILPFGNPLWQVSLLSCICGALALVFLYKIARKITHSRSAALFSVLCLGTFESFWFYALTAQVHVLQVLLIAIVVYFLLQFLETKKIKSFSYAFLFFGLGVSNNLTIILLLPVCMTVLYFVRKSLSLGDYGKLVFYGILGLLPYLYLIYAAGQNSPASWGGVHDVISFFRLIFRSDYGSLDWVSNQDSAPFLYSTFVFYWEYLFQTSWFVLPFVIVSFFSFRKNKLVYAIIFSSFVLFGPFFYYLLQQSVLNVVYQANAAPYFSYSYFFLSILSGIGVSVLVNKFHLPDAVFLNILVILFFIPVFFITLPKVRLDTNNLTAVTTLFEFSELPQNAIVITSGDSLSLPGRYWEYAQQNRRDVTIIDGGLLSFPWYRALLAHFHPAVAVNFSTPTINYDRLCRVYAASGRLFVSPWYPDFDAYFQKNCLIIPYGLVGKVIPKNTAIPLSVIKKLNDTQWRDYTALVQPQEFRNDYLRTREQLFYLGEQKNFVGIFYLRYGQKEWALHEFEIARTISPDEVNSIIGESALLYGKGEYAQGIALLNLAISENSAQRELYKNLAIFYEKVQNPLMAYENFKKYLSFNPIGDSDVPNIVNFVNSYESGQNTQSTAQ